MNMYEKFLSRRHGFCNCLLVLLLSGTIHTALSGAAATGTATAAAPIGVPAEEGQTARSVAVLFREARQAIAFNRLPEALSLVEQGLSIDPAYLPFYRLRAEALMKLDRTGEAEKAIALALRAMPTDIALNSMAVENTLLHAKGSPEEKSVRLANCFANADPSVLPPLAAKLVAQYAGTPQEKNILDALADSGTLDERESAVLRTLLSGEADKAAEQAEEMAEGMTERAPRAPLAGALAYLAGEALDSPKAVTRVDSLYGSAARLGFDQTTLVFARARNFSRAGQARDAASVFSEYFRHAPEPNLIAVNAAEQYIKAGQADDALGILRKALAASPNESYLQGRYLSLLALYGAPGEYQDYARVLENNGEIVGLAFGKFLMAREKTGQPVPEAEYQALRLALKSNTDLQPLESVTYIRQSVGREAAPVDPVINAYVTEAWKAWDAKNYRLACKYFQDAFTLGLSEDKEHVLQVSTLLIRQGLEKEGMAILREYYPDVPVSALALRMRRGARSASPQPSLQALLQSLSRLDNVSEELLPWQRLAEAQAAIWHGSDAEAVAALQRLATTELPPVYVPAALRNQNGLASFKLTRSRYLSIFSEMTQRIAKQGNAELLLALVGSAQMGALPAGKAAGMYSEAAFRLLRWDRPVQARPLAGAALSLDGGSADAHLVMAVMEKMTGNNAASRRHLHYISGAKRDKQVFAMSRLSRLEGDPAGAAQYIEQYLKTAPGDLPMLHDLFSLHMENMGFTAARTVRNRIAGRAKGERSGYYARHYLVLCDLALGRYEAAESVLRAVLKKIPAYKPALLDLGAVFKAQRRYADNRNLMARNGLEDPDTLGVWQWLTREALRDYTPETAQHMAERYFERNPDSYYMHTLYDQALLDQWKLEEAEAHANAILARNGIQTGALDTLYKASLRRNDADLSGELSRQIAETFPYDPSRRIESVLQSTDLGSFRYLFNHIERMTSSGPNASTAVWLFPGINAYEDEDALPLSEVERQIRKAREHYDFVSLPSVPMRPRGGKETDQAGPIPLLLIIGGTDGRYIRAVDRMLEQYQGRAALLVGEESFMEGTPDNRPDLDLLRELRATGRWDFILTDSRPRRIVTDASGREKSFWDAPAWLGERQETPEEMRGRWAAALGRIKARAKDSGFDIDSWMYPGGDYGHYKLDVDDKTRQAYVSAVKAHFSQALVTTHSGYHLEGAESAFVPVRVFYTPLPNEKITELARNSPSRYSTLVEGVAASWHGQTPKAEKLLRRAAGQGQPLKDVVYYRAANAFYAGDAAQANILARSALALDPESHRAIALLKKAERMKRPRLAPYARVWTDSEDRTYEEYGAVFSGHINDSVSLSASAAGVFWGNDGGHAKGWAGGLGMRVYACNQHWLDLNARVIVPESGNDTYGEWGVAWTGVYSTDFLDINGRYTLLYQREGIETLESMEEGIYADRFALNGDLRVLNWGVLGYDFYGITRTDGNNTVGMSLKPGYIVWDKPHVQFAYHLDLADSDRNPDEYWAPKQYQSHMAAATVKHALTDWLSAEAFARYGRARSEGNSWREVLRYGAGFSLDVTETIKLDANYRKLKLPGYEMDTVYTGLQIIF